MVKYPKILIFLSVFTFLPIYTSAEESAYTTKKRDFTEQVSETDNDEAPSDGVSSTNKSTDEQLVDGSAELAEPDVSDDLDALPFPTRRMHELILEATQSGDIEKLRPLIGIGDSATQLSLGAPAEDPIEFLRNLSGDAEGHEILAILEEVLEAGYVHLDEGTNQEIYVWPYFFGVSLEKLTARQRVDLFRIVTYGDYADFKDFGGYIFYRVGITPTGRWSFFVAGD